MNRKDKSDLNEKKAWTVEFQDVRIAVWEAARELFGPNDDEVDLGHVKKLSPVLDRDEVEVRLMDIVVASFERTAKRRGRIAKGGRIAWREAFASVAWRRRFAKLWRTPEQALARGLRGRW